MPDSVDEQQEHDDEAGGCPVCKLHSDADMLASQQVIFLGAKALLDRDDQMLEDVFTSLTNYDAHMAISLLVSALADIGMMTGIPVRALVDKARENLTNAQQQAKA